MLAEEDFERHECDLPLNDCKTIEVAYFTDLSGKTKEIVSGRGIDGVLYIFEVVPRKPIPMITPLSKRKVTWRVNKRRGNSTGFGDFSWWVLWVYCLGIKLVGWVSLIFLGFF